ncbi:Phytanoyl-CoA dioxygenase (PhyH) [Oceanospirillum multiglobuliferum]|uniref:Phytanoyl-CoA dioxygenase n=1 Tax=Oceanospirillum multiglobuliferum TaxID=64969 RepID=A0A1T4LVI6_9GAMM|nr:phytanoyl-CoA dioxygenase family protein [Oceanospirillum multiglobuliferum]OPX56349.1 phytanoyl-CoA dioxygenase [Oceanospirillum multiglobuliferum]SJZ58646.1 Phytanoyl-CoA dioxygenase (PhyH) [Oceanospirillum multiglobuliferum]
MSTFSITEQQKHDYQTKGYIKLENALPAELLEKWQKKAKQLEEKAMQMHGNSEHLHGACVIQDPVGPRLMRYDDLHIVETELSIELLSCPAMMAIARELCGRGAVPLQMDLLYKQQHPHPVIKWHQGAQHPRNFPYLNIGVYLDDAPEGDGCLRYVAGTQNELLDIEKISTEHGWNVPGVVELPAKAGDILIQDMMILHGSQPKRSPGVRRTIYIEYRPFDGIYESGAQSEEWADLRKQWMVQVIEHADQQEWPEEWRQDYPTAVSNLDSLMQVLHEKREPPIPAVWGINPVELEDYPVPADMKDW